MVSQHFHELPSIFALSARRAHTSQLIDKSTLIKEGVAYIDAHVANFKAASLVNLD